jgi:acetyl-CoA synthetase
MRLPKPPQKRRPPRGVAEVVELTNVAVRLMEAFPQGNHYALAHVDPLGVIEPLRFADVEREIARWTDLLREQGVKPGDRVVVLAGRDRQWRCALLGVLQLGGVAVPCPASTPVAEIRTIATRARAVLFASARARPDLAEPAGIPVLAADEPDPYAASSTAARPPHMALPDDVALILYARDASGLHGAMHTHASLLAQAEAGEYWLGVREDERV